MNNNEIKEALSQLQEMEYLLNEEYENNGGEVTDYTEQQEKSIEALRELLTTEGVDSLGRWLKSKEDEVKALKAEKDYVARRIESANNTIDYIKTQVYNLMTATGMEKVKGSLGYSFAPTMSVKTTVDKDILKDMFLERIEEKVREFVPKDVTITLGASVKALPEGVDLPLYYSRTESPSCRFTKPRASKEE